MKITVAYKTIFYPIFLFVVIIIGVISAFLLIGVEEVISANGIEILAVIIVVYFIVVIVKIAKPKMLISKDKEGLILHLSSHNVYVPYETIENIAVENFLFSTVLVVKTKYKKYRISDVKDVHQVYEKLLSLVYEINDII